MVVKEILDLATFCRYIHINIYDFDDIDLKE